MRSKRKHLGAVFVALLIVVGLVAPAAAAPGGQGADRVTICKRTTTPGGEFSHEISVPSKFAERFADKHGSQAGPCDDGGSEEDPDGGGGTTTVATVVELQASAVCAEDGVNELGYIVSGTAWATGTLTVSVEDAVVQTVTVSANSSGVLAWPTDGDVPVASVVVSLSVTGSATQSVQVDAECEVLDVVVEEPIEESEEEPEVLDEVLEEEETLPETGASALLLSLLGLLSMGTGGALLRRRR
jgi:LPXTG-motif cell wall-anchored protein